MLRLSPMAVTHPSLGVRVCDNFRCQAGLPLLGPIIGQEVLGQGMFCYDPFCLRHRDVALAVHAGLGRQGVRQVRLRQGLSAPPIHGREVAGHLGPKGEYLDLAAATDSRCSGLRPGRPVRLNPLDAGPAISAGTDDVRGHRIGVVVALAESAMDDR